MCFTMPNMFDSSNNALMGSNENWFLKKVTQMLNLHCMILVKVVYLYIGQLILIQKQLNVCQSANCVFTLHSFCIIESYFVYISLRQFQFFDVGVNQPHPPSHYEVWWVWLIIITVRSQCLLR